jgi:hypothetical protein
VDAFPAGANRTPVGGERLPTTLTKGWLYLDLGAGFDPLQSFVTARIQEGAPSARGLVDATPLDAGSCGSAPAPATPIP